MITFPIAHFKTSDLTEAPTQNLIADWDPAFGCVDGESATSTDGTGLYQWTDQASSLVAEQSSSGDQPTWRDGTTAPTAANPYVDFPGLEFMEVLSSTTSFQQNQITFYCVIDFQGTPGSFDTLFHKGTDYYWDDGWRVGTGTSNQWEGWVNDEVYEASNTNSSNAREAKAIRFDVDNTGTKIIQSIVKNPSTEAVTYTTGTTPIGNNDAPSKNALLGASWDSAGTDGTFFIDGHVFRVLIYDTYHDDSTAEAILDFLHKKYVSEVI